MKESGEMRLKSTIYESTLSTAARSPFPNGEGKKEAASPHLLEDRLMYAACESTLSTAARSPFPDGEGKKEAASPHLLEEILFEYVFSCAFVNDSGNFLNNNIEMIHDLKIGISNNEDSELF